MSREAMQMALEALEDANDVARMEFGDEDYYSEAINALRQALATEQEPVGWYDSISGEMDFTFYRPARKPSSPSAEWIPVYAAPPKREWVGLTDEEIAQGLKESWVTEQAWQSAVWWAEAKLKEKNHG